MPQYDTRAVDAVDRPSRAMQAEPGNSPNGPTIGGVLQSIRDNQRKTLATLHEMIDTIIGPGPETADDNKRPESPHLMDMGLDNADLSERIISMSRKVLKLLGERKG